MVEEKELEDEKPLSQAEREKLLAELKQRLREIETLKHELGVASEANGKGEPGKEESSLENMESREEDSRYMLGSIREALEELRVPPLELLKDEPWQKKPKKEAEET